MSTETDNIDTAIGSLKTAIAAYTTAGGNGFTLAQWLISQIRQSDPAVALALQNNITRFIAEAPDRRTFASIG
jgi:hypothetical protein